jgi:YhcN/YlaJ family sporulation lipoprotein
VIILKKLLVGFLLTLFLSTCLITGCTPARKPAPRPTKTAPTPTDRTKMTPDKQRADRIAREATQIKGVRKTVVVVSGKTAFIGLDLETREGAASKRVKDQVARRVTTAEPSLKTVNVTADPDLVTRLRKVADGINKGKPVSSFSRELSEIGRRIEPKMR